MRKGAKAYLAASVVAQGSALIRYVLLARILGPEQLGLAAMLILTAQFFESISDTGADRFIVQDPDGGSPLMQRLIQLVMALRGIGIALALVLSAGLLSSLYHAPSLTMSLVALALAPLIAGFIHMDVRRAQRDADFRPESATIILGETASLVGTGLAAVITRDHTAVIYGLVLRAAAMVVVSHINATRPYRWGYSKVEGLRFSHFAAPLFLNGLLLFVGSQGDRILVGSHVGAAALGQYSAILLLIVNPTSALSKFLMGVHLPPMSASRDDADRFRLQTERLGGRALLLSVAVASGFALVAPFFTPLLYGHQFAQRPDVFALLAVLQATRFIRFWPTTVAVAVGRSMIVMLNNLARMVGLPIALAVYAYSPSLEGIVAGFIVGEFVALLVALILLNRAGAVSLNSELGRVGILLVTSALIISWAWTFESGFMLAFIPLLLATAAATFVLARRERLVIGELRTMVVARLSGRR